MVYGGQIGALLIILSLTTAGTLLWRSNFSPRTFVGALFGWHWRTWSFDSEWLSQRQLAAFTLLYATIGITLLLGILPPILVILGAISIALVLTLADYRLATHVGKNGIPDVETQALSQWRWFNSEKAHKFVRHVESGKVTWVPSTLTVISIPLFTLAVGLFWLILAPTYPGSAHLFALISAFTVSAPPILTCMLGPHPTLFSRR